MDEFALIEELFAPLTEGAPEALGLADDAAVLGVGAGRRLVVTADMVVAGAHFLPDDSAALVARKLLRVNLSDLAAMAAVPRAYLITIAVPEGTEESWLRDFAGGLAEDQAAYGLHLIGGDTVATQGPFTASLTAIGEVDDGNELRRDGAKPGDHIYVSGSLGDAALGLKALRGEFEHLDDANRAVLVDRYRLPRPRLELGARLAGLAHAAIDVSDGLVADVGHICERSGVGAEIEAWRLPMSRAAQAVFDADPSLATLALCGGDDYELAFTVAGDAGRTVASLCDSLSLPLTPVGRILEGSGVRAIDPLGAEIPLAASGYRHF